MSVINLKFHFKGETMNAELKQMVKIVNNLTPVKVISSDELSVDIYLEEFDFTYKLLHYDTYFLEALKIIKAIELARYDDYIRAYGDKFKVFSIFDLLELQNAIREDENKLGSVYAGYFYDPITGSLRREADKYYLMKYIEFVKNATRL